MLLQANVYYYRRRYHCLLYSHQAVIFVIIFLKTCQSQSLLCLTQRCCFLSVADAFTTDAKGCLKGATTGSSTQHPIPKNHPSAMLVARQQCLSSLFPYSPYSHILFFFFLLLPVKLAWCSAQQSSFYYLGEGYHLTTETESCVSCQGVDKFSTGANWVWDQRVFLYTLSLSYSFHRDEQHGSNSHKKSGMELFKKQFSLNSREDMERAFH